MLTLASQEKKARRKDELQLREIVYICLATTGDDTTWLLMMLTEKVLLILKLTFIREL